MNVQKSNRLAVPAKRRRGPIQSARVFPRWVWRTRIAVLLLVAASVNLGASVARAQDRSDGEYRIKAAFVYNFAKFVDWPTDALPDSTAAIVIGVVGEEQLSEVLAETVAGKTANGRELVVRRWKVGQDLRNCQLLFISASEGRRLPQILRRLKGSSVLTVGETEQFTRLGGIINLFVVGKNVRFEISVGAAARARLKISSKLLALARIVPGEQAEGKD